MAQQPNPTPMFVSPTEAAATLGVNIKTVYRAIRQGTLPSVRVGRTIRIPSAALLGACIG
jgi:excisionase family DNA binding protein